MALQIISANSEPSYLALSSDIIDNKIQGASLVGKIVFIIDTGIRYIINSDLTLSEYPITSTSKFISTDGTIYGFMTHGGLPMICNQTFLETLSRGVIANTNSWVKIGYNGNLGSSIEDFWPVGGSYTNPTSQMAMEVVSTSTEDNSSGTGVRSIRIFYLDNLFTEKTTDVILNGLTPVQTSVSDIYRINYGRTLTVGSNKAAVGDINIRHISDTPIYGQISSGYNRLRQMIYTIPKNKSLYITNVLPSCGSNVTGRHVNFFTQGTFDQLMGIVPYYQVYTEFILQDNITDIILEMPTKFITGTDIKISAISLEGVVEAAVVVRGWLESV